MGYLLAALGGKDRFPLLEGVQPLRLAVQHIVVKLFKVDIQSYLGAALKAVQLYLLEEVFLHVVKRMYYPPLMVYSHYIQQQTKASCFLSFARPH